MRPGLIGAFAGIVLVILTAVTGKADAIDPRNVQDNAAVPAGRLDALNTIGQSFVFRYPRLHSIQVRWIVSDDLQYASESRVALHLRHSMSDPSDIATASIAVSDLRNNAYGKFDFFPIQNSRDQSFYFFLDASQAEITRGYISLWASDQDDYPDGQMHVNGNATDQDLVFRAYYEPDLPFILQSLKNMLAKYARGLLLGLIIVLVPGLSILLLQSPPGKLDGAEMIAAAGGLSLAFFSAGAIILMWLGQSLIWYAIPLFAAFLVLSIILAGRLFKRFRPSSREPLVIQPQNPAASQTSEVSETSEVWHSPTLQDFFGGVLGEKDDHSRYTPWALVAFSVVSVLLGFLQIRDISVPLWKDSPVHAEYIASIIDQARLPAISFYHFGFHSVVALLAQVSGMTIPESMLLMGQLLITQCGLSVFLLTKQLAKSEIAALVSAVCVWFLSPTPAHLITWGRYPLLMGAALLPLALFFAVRFIEQTQIEWAILTLAVVTFVGTAFAHARLIAFYVIFVVIYWAFRLAWNPRERGSAAIPVRIGLAAGASLLFAWLWLSALFERGLDWQNILPHDSGTVQLDLSTALDVSLLHHGPLLLVLALLGIIISIAERRSTLAVLVTYVVLYLISVVPLPVIGEEYLPTPLIVLMGFLPVAVLVGELMNYLYAKTTARSDRKFNTAAAVWGVTLLMISILGARDMTSIVNPSSILFTDADQKAMEWIKEHTSSSSKFLVNSIPWLGSNPFPSDGGWWIPSLTERPISILDSAEMPTPENIARALDTQGIDLIYFGTRAGVLRKNDFTQQPDRYRLLYNRDGISIFGMRSAFLPITASPLPIVCNGEC